MTEEGWLGGSDPQQMVKELRAQASKRKSRLFAVACCRRIWDLLPEGASREAVVTAERYADGLAADAEREEALARASEALEALQALGDSEWAREGVGYLHWLSQQHTLGAAGAAACTVEAAVEEHLVTICAEVVNAVAPSGFLGYNKDESIRRDRQQEQAAQCVLLRCLFGNVFRPVSFSPTWRSGPVGAVARAAYEERALPGGRLDPSRLAVLADALEEAGCPSAELLGHLRDRGPHSRGCWAVDLVLARE
jgi:hypothetical protein